MSVQDLSSTTKLLAETDNFVHCYHNSDDEQSIVDLPCTSGASSCLLHYQDGEEPSSHVIQYGREEEQSRDVSQYPRDEEHRGNLGTNSCDDSTGESVNESATLNRKQRRKLYREDENQPSCEDCYKGSGKPIKAIFSIFLSVVMLTCLVMSKGILLFVASQLHPYVTFTSFYNSSNAVNGSDACYTGVQCMESNTVAQHNVRWLWAMYICQCAPYLFMFFACIWKICFRNKPSPDLRTFVLVVIMETLHSIGMFILLYVILPVIDAFRALLLCTAVAIIPSFLHIFYGMRAKKIYIAVLDVIAFLAQFSAMLVWPVSYRLLGDIYDSSIYNCTRNGTGIITDSMQSNHFHSVASEILTKDDIEEFWPIKPLKGSIVPENMTAVYLIPLALFLCSLPYWTNFIDSSHWRPNTGNVGWINFFHKLKHNIEESKVKLYAFISIYKIVISFACLLICISCTKSYANVEVKMLFEHKNFYDDYGHLKADWISQTAIQVCVGMIGFFVADIAIKGHMQVVSYTIPLVLSTPVVFGLLAWACETCQDIWNLPIDNYYFWNCFQGYSDLGTSSKHLLTYAGIFWWISQLWIARYLWFSNVERLAHTKKIFTMPMYCGALLEQSLIYIRRRNDEEKTLKEEYQQTQEEDNSSQGSVERGSLVVKLEGYNPLFDKSQDSITPIVYMCATFWHENEKEMTQILHSIIRTDFDAASRRKAKDQSFLDPDFYEFEFHVFFDDAFTAHTPESDDYTVNMYVIQMLDCLAQAAKQFFKGREFRFKSPVRYATPYGGKLVFMLPFGNKMAVHLKDKQKIRNRKRWSQVMYLHYFLVQGIDKQPFMDKHRDIVAKNTYILALDGDVDFEPKALILLLDLMKRDSKVAAACGRIHPIGQGPMVWYQKFEYSLSHWLQKATEHVLGCVLCSPGCFSLFRASALMDTFERYSIMATAPQDHVQYDQGEDRWLCTLLLQEGHRVEYSGASDAKTYAPEEFKEFFNQRRRWITSTFANIIDLLQTGRQTAHRNDNISTLYIIYQGALFLSSILGPATIFLLLMNAVDIVFEIGMILSTVGGAIPLLLFGYVCYKCKNDTQVKVALGLSVCTMVLQTFVVIGLFRQMVTDGVCNPQAIFCLVVTGIFVIAAILHPQEAYNIIYIPVYFILVPCMYLILTIFSLCNINSVSWGTRENKEASKPKEKKKAPQTAGEGMKDGFTDLMSSLGFQSEDDGNSGYSLRCGTCCRMACCLNSADTQTDKLMRLEEEVRKVGENQRDTLEFTKNEFHTIQMQIYDLKQTDSIAQGGHQVSALNSRLLPVVEEYHRASDSDQTEQEHDTPLELATADIHSISEPNTQRNIHTPDEQDKSERRAQESMQSEEIETLRENDSDPQNPNWINHGRLAEGECKILSEEETNFWADLIKTYLWPLDDDKDKRKKTEDDLRHLRDKVVLGFFVIDLILISAMVGLSITIEQVDDMAISWNCTVGYRNYVSHLQPIGFLFIFVFGIIMVIQFIGMFLHQVFTFLQIVSVTALFSRNAEDKAIEEMSPAEFIEVMKKLLAPTENDEEASSEMQNSGSPTQADDTGGAELQLTDPHPIDREPVRLRRNQPARQINGRHRILSNEAIARSFDSKWEASVKWAVAENNRIRAYKRSANLRELKKLNRRSVPAWFGGKEAHKFRNTLAAIRSATAEDIVQRELDDEILHHSI